jgi:hypothetical protein
MARKTRTTAPAVIATEATFRALVAGNMALEDTAIVNANDTAKSEGFAVNSPEYWDIAIRTAEMFREGC